MNSSAIPATSTPSWGGIPLIHPPVKDAFEIDEELLHSRARVINVVALAVFLASFCYPAMQIGLCCLGFALYSMPFLDRAIAERAIDENAVSEYLNVEKPAAKASQRIAWSVRAAMLYILHAGDLNKQDVDGRFLIRNALFDGYLSEVNKVLFRNGFNLMALDDNKELVLSRIMYNVSNLDVEYFLKHRLITFEKLASYPLVQFSLIRSVTEGQLELMKEYGFNLDVRSSNNLTPLISEICSHSPNKERIERLLKLGADPYLTVGSFFWRLNAWGLTKDLEILEILDRYKR